MKYCNTHYGMYDEAAGCLYCNPPTPAYIGSSLPKYKTYWLPDISNLWSSGTYFIIQHKAICPSQGLVIKPEKPMLLLGENRELLAEIRAKDKTLNFRADYYSKIDTTGNFVKSPSWRLFSIT